MAQDAFHKNYSQNLSYDTKSRDTFSLALRHLSPRPCLEGFRSTVVHITVTVMDRMVPGMFRQESYKVYTKLRRLIKD